MRYIRTLLFGFLLLVLLNMILVPFSLTASSGTINDDGVNVRSGPGTTYTIINTLTKGTGVAILQTKGDWQEIQYGNLKGWVATRFISANGGSSKESSSTPAKTTSDKYIQVVSGPANVRSEPNSNSDKVAMLEDQTICPVLEQKGDWYKIRLSDGSTGYIAAWLVKETGGNSKPLPIAKPVVSKLAPDVIKLSQEKDETGIKISMKSGAALKGQIKEKKDQVTYEFSHRQINGLSYIEEPIGTGLIKVRGRSEKNKAIVEIEFPKDSVYRTSSEDGGKTEIFTIVNSIKELEEKKFGVNGEKIVITTATPMKYSHRLKNGLIKIDLINMAKGNANDRYHFDSDLIKEIRVTSSKDSAVHTIITIETDQLGKYTAGITQDGTALNILLVNKGSIKPRQKNLVVLDPGHGGKDTGARGGKLYEKDVNLAVALKIGQILQQNGVRVEYTRQTDEYINPEARAKAANKSNAALFISIHSNANPNKNKQGTETYYYAPVNNSTLFLMQDERRSLAAGIQQSLSKQIQRPNCGVKAANFSVLKYTTMPSVLVELAFISNPDEEQLLMSDAFCNQAAEGVVDGILRYMGK